MVYDQSKNKEYLVDTFKKLRDAPAAPEVSDVALDLLASVLIDQIIKEYKDNAFRSYFPGPTTSQGRVAT